MKTYQELTSELPTILQIVEKAPESVQEKVLEILVASFLGQSIARPAISGPTPSPNSEHPQVPSVKGRKKKASAESYRIDKTLSLRRGGTHGSFREFYSAKSPQSAAEFNAVAVYFLVHAAGISHPTFDQVYTCYKDAGRRTPEHFKQSVIDTKNKQGWIDLTDDGSIVITHRGTEFVEHDLPKEKPTKSDRRK
jgi:hypothetical protein